MPTASSAAFAHPFLGSFCEPTGVGAAPCEPTFGEPAGIAIDPATGDVFVIDLEDQTLHRFKPDGEPAPFSALPGNVIDGHPGGEDETPSGVILSNEGFGSTEVEVAVAPPGAAGGTEGDIYVTNAYEEEAVDIFAPSGKYIGKIEGEGYACGVAVDPGGSVYVGDYYFGVHKLTPTAPASFGPATDFSYPETCQVAAGAQPLASGGSEGFVFATKFEGPVTKVASEGPEEGNAQYVASAGGNTTVGVDPGTGHLYVATGEKVNEYDVSGSKGSVLFATISPGGEALGVAADGSSGNVYASVHGGAQVKVFGPPVPLPEVFSEEAEPLTDTTTTLNGVVDPNGEPLTECVFEYGATTSYGETAPCEPAAGSIPSDSQPHAVTAQIAALSPDTVYHFRLSASTAEGTSQSAGAVFRTAIGAPTIGSESVVAAGLSEATVSAQIDPMGAPTTYRVEYGTSGSYSKSTAASAPIGSPGDGSEHTISVKIEELEPATTYHFRFVATSAVASTPGADATFATYFGPQLFGPCANDALRTGPGAALPDCRAYEQASPAEKFGGGIIGGLGTVESSRDGSHITFGDNSGLPTSGGSSEAPLFVASRSAGGWSTDGLLPRTEQGDTAQVLGWSEELTTSLAEIAQGPAAGLYLRETATGSQQHVVSAEKLHASGGAIGFAAEDGADFIFESEKALKKEESTAHVPNLYEVDHGALTVVGRVPAFPATTCSDACVTPAAGAFAGAYNWVGGSGLSSPGPRGELGTISADGSRVFFTESGTGRLYVREDGVRTTQVSAPAPGVTDPNGEKAAAYVGATPTGSTVFFLSCQKLTADSTAVSTPAETCSNTQTQGQDLYAYDTTTGSLADLTVDHADPFGAQVVGFVGSSEDGSDIYFIANGVLAPGATAGTCTISNQPSGSCSLYLVQRESGGSSTLSFVARLDAESGDQSDWLGLPSERASRVSADGAVLFRSTRQLTGYDNHGVGEFYRFVPGEAMPSCVSCNPTGAAPVGPPTLQTNGVPFTAVEFHRYQGFLTRNISADGERVFFQTPDKLVAADVNGEHGCPQLGRPEDVSYPACNDVYEWEAMGEGSCASEAQDGGCLYLISTGTSAAPAFFGDADASGENVFFLTEASLAPQDKDRLYDMYDARVEGGLASQHAGEPPTCSGEGCRETPAAAPSQPTAGSTLVSGPGNPKQKHKKKQKKPKKHKHKQKKHGKSKARRGGHK